MADFNKYKYGPNNNAKPEDYENSGRHADYDAYDQNSWFRNEENTLLDAKKNFDKAKAHNLNAKLIKTADYGPFDEREKVVLQENKRQEFPKRSRYANKTDEELKEINDANKENFKNGLIGHMYKKEGIEPKPTDIDIELARRERAKERRDRHNTLKNDYGLEDKEYNPLAEALKDSGRQPILEDDNGDYWHVEYKDGKLVAGHATNSGIVPEFEIDYDHDSSLDGNLERLWDKIHK